MKKPDKVYFWFAGLLFVTTITFSFVVGIYNQTFMRSTILQALPDFSDFTSNSNLQNFIIIFTNNASKSLVIIFSGIFLGLLPIYIIYTNAQLIGLVAAMVYLHTNMVVVLAGLLPHGITESFAIILSTGYGIWLGAMTLRWLLFHEWKNFKQALKISFLEYIKIVLPLLLFSAMIEAFITPSIIHFFGG